MLQVVQKRPKPKPSRNSAQVIAEILDSIRSGEKITRICTNANVGGEVVVQYLDFMIKMGMIERVITPEGVIYKPLEKGIINYTLLLELGSFKLVRKEYPKKT